jgi:glucose-6-phosphate 1-dehydrogenase
VQDQLLDKLIERIHYQRLEFNEKSDYLGLKKSIESLSGAKCGSIDRVYYLAVPSSFFGVIAQNLKHFGLADKHSDKNYSRVMFEKPFGHDLKSAKELNAEITEVFDEKQIYRIDHYMAKELVQNMMVLRFANSIFEPLWNRKYIDHIQITVAETLGVEGRGDYYDKFGALRDVIQNHVMQLLTLVAMEEPNHMDIDGIRNEKVRLLKSVKMGKDPSKTAVKGQYCEGQMEGRKVSAYAMEPEVKRNSLTDTYFAMKIEVANNMWKGVPFYLRTGKRLKERATEIVIVYKDVPFELFRKNPLDKNMMIIRVQPYEGITLQFNAKVPGNKILIDNVTMDFCHECKFGPNTPEAYERLLYDVMAGDQTLFTRWDEAEWQWRVVEPILKSGKKLKLSKYSPGTWGPEDADKLIEKDGRKWVAPKKPAYAEQLEMMNK